MPIPRDCSCLNRQFELLPVAAFWSSGQESAPVRSSPSNQLLECRTSMDTAALHDLCGEVRVLEAIR
jgi:hypothetical protein